jgi:hypothetical protein
MVVVVDGMAANEEMMPRAKGETNINTRRVSS